MKKKENSEYVPGLPGCIQVCPCPFCPGKEGRDGIRTPPESPKCSRAAEEKEPLPGAPQPPLFISHSSDRLLTHSLRDSCISRQGRNDKPMTNHSRFRQQVDQRLSSGNAAVPGGGGNNPGLLLLPKHLCQLGFSQALNPPKTQAVQGTGREKRSLKHEFV